MNPLTVAVFTLMLLYTLGAIIYAWRIGRRAGRAVFTRFVVGFLAVWAALELLLFALYRDEPLGARGLWPSLLQGLFIPQYAVLWLRIPRSPMPDRYPYTPSREDVCLVWLALVLPGVALLAVAAVLISHALTAHR